MPTDYYSILQVHTDAEQEIIVAAYRRLARKYHPDVNRMSDATLRMQKINEAYDVLADSEKRRLYDQEYLHMQSGAHELRAELERVENQLLDEQIARKDIEDELAAAIQELRIEQLRRKREERKSLRLAEQLKEDRPRIKQPHTPQPSVDAASAKAAQLRLQRKYDVMEKELAEERRHTEQLREELATAAADVEEERNGRGKSGKKIARLEQMLAAERERREKREEEIYLAEYERQAKEKTAALRGDKQVWDGKLEGENGCDGYLHTPFVAEKEIAEERRKRELAENELTATRGVLRNLAVDLKSILSGF